jgi:DNA modification methylase
LRSGGFRPLHRARHGLTRGRIEAEAGAANCAINEGWVAHMTVEILIGDCREKLRGLPDASVNCCVTSPPYFGLRDYGVDGQMGLESAPDDFVAGMVEVFREVRRVLRDDGTLWLNIGDTYAGSGKGAWANKDGGQKEVYIPDPDSPQTKLPKTWDGIKAKDLIGIPWMLAFALRADGWYLRQDIIWSKPNPMPESVRDRCTKAHEYLFLLSKGSRYHFDSESISEPAQGWNGSRFDTGKRPRASPCAMDFWGLERFGAPTVGGGLERRNRRSVWEVATQPFSDAHFATYPPALIDPCILAGCPKGGTVLDPFFGAGTTGLVADRLQRNCIGIELNPEYAAIAERRLAASRGGLLDIMEGLAR